MSAAAKILAIAGGAPAVYAPHASWPEIREEDRVAISGVLDRGILWGTHAPEISGLEHDWATYMGATHCLALNSGTAALHCATAALDLKPGDEVIVPAFSFVASGMAVVHQGATPVFCDIDPRTYNVDPALIAERISARTKAIMVVHVHGLVADMDAVLAVARRHGLPVIEDAAQAHGAEYRGRKAGTFGVCAAFSLNATKSLSGGEGGLFVTDDPEIYRTARRLSMFGEDADRGESDDPARPYISHGIGFNYRHHELSAALARSQLRRLDDYNAAARQNAEILTVGLDRLTGVKPPHVPVHCTPVFHKYRVRLDLPALEGPGTRDAIVRAMRAEGVEATLWQTHPLPAQRAFRRALRPWHPARDAELLQPFDPAEYPHASRLLETSFVLGSERAPLAVQHPSLMRQYVAALRKVLDNLDRVVADAQPTSVLGGIGHG